MSAFARASGSLRIAVAPGLIPAISDRNLRPKVWQLRLGMLLLLACAGWLAPTPAQAWSAFGHRLVGLLAQDQLPESTRAQVDALLALEPDADMGTVAAWADEVRELPRYESTGPFHYVNIKDANCYYLATRDCPDGACIVAALPQYQQILGDRAQPETVRLEALKFVVHLVGDAHQPLHAGNRDDRGGNQFQINLKGEATNLHAVWDYHVLHNAGLDLAGYRQRLGPRVAVASVGSMAVVDWAQAACALLDRQSLYPRRPGKLPARYLDEKRPIAEDQIVLAAARLAAVLEQALGTTGRADVQR